jgi:chromosome segregation ATPase
LKAEVASLKETSENLSSNLNRTVVELETLEAKFESTTQEKDEKIATLEENLEKALTEKNIVVRKLKSLESVNWQLKKNLTLERADREYIGVLKAELKKLKTKT